MLMARFDVYNNRAPFTTRKVNGAPTVRNVHGLPLDSPNITRDININVENVSRACASNLHVTRASQLICKT